MAKAAAPEAGAPEEELDDVTTPPRGLQVDAGAEAVSPTDSSPAISSAGLDWESEEPATTVMPPELAQNLAPATSGAAAVSQSAGARSAASDEDLQGWSESLVGWIPEESRIAAIPAEGSSRTGLIVAAVVAALVVGGGGVAAAVLLSGDDAPEVAAESAPKPPEPGGPAVAAPAESPPAESPPEPPPSDHEPEIILDEDDLILEDDATDGDPGASEQAPTKTTKKKSYKPPKTESSPSGPVVELSASTVRREIAQNMFHIHRCYDAALKRDPNLEGRYSVTITISTGGRVSRVVIDRDTLRHSGVASCVKRKIKDWRFPIKGRLAEATEVSFPVTFKR